MSSLRKRVSNHRPKSSALYLTAIAIVCVASPVWGQRGLLYDVYDLAPNHSGDRVLFNTMRALPAYGFDGKDHLYLAEGRDIRRAVEDPRSRCGLLGSARAHSPSFLPGSDRDFSYHETFDCLIGRLSRSETYIRLENNPWIADQTPGTLLWGAMGKYAILSSSSDLVRLADGMSFAIPKRDADDRRLSLNFLKQPISERGEVIMLALPLGGVEAFGRPTLWNGVSVTALDLPDSSDCALDPKGRYVVCVAYAEKRPQRAIMLDLQTLEQKVLGEIPAGAYWIMRFSANGDRMLVMRSADAGWVEAYAMPEGTLTHSWQNAGDWVGLSGNGRYAFFGGRDGLLRRFDFDTGAEETWIDPVP